MRFHPLRLLQQFPSHEQNRENTNHRVRKEKGRYIPLAWQKYGVATDESHNEAACESIPGQVGLKDAFIREAVAGEALSFAGPLEADEGVGHDGEVDQLGGRDLWPLALHN